ncbi:hypothetical protein CR513_28426, partial [Mucuna pruriens]
MVVYFDDILLYSSCIDYHILHVRSVLLLLRQECLYVSPEKFIFRTFDIVFLGYVVDSKGVKALASIASHLNEIVKKDIEENQEKAFQTLKERLTNTTILALPNFSKTFELECDAFDVGV